MKFRCKEYCKRRRGFTMLEVVVSLSILTMSTLSILGLCIYSAKLGKQSEARATALSIARSQIDQLTSVSQSNRTLISDQPITIPADLRSQMPGANLSATYSIKAVPGSSNLQQIEVTVKWRNATAGDLNSPFTSVSAMKTISSTTNMTYNSYNGLTPHTSDEFFYTPPPPPPPPTTTTGGTTTSSTTTGSTSSSTDGTTGSSSTGSTAGSTTGSTDGSTTGSTTGTTASVYVPPTPTGFMPGSGTKWK